MQNRSFTLKEKGLIAVLGVAVFAVFKLIAGLKRYQLTGPHDKPIVVSGGSLYVSSRAHFTASAAQKLQVNMSLHAVREIKISVNQGDPVSYIPNPGESWQLIFIGTPYNLGVTSDGSSLVAFSDLAANFDDTFSDAYIGLVKKHHRISPVSQIRLSGAGMSAEPSVMDNKYYVVMHYSE